MTTQIKKEIERTNLYQKILDLETKINQVSLTADKETLVEISSHNLDNSEIGSLVFESRIPHNYNEKEIIFDDGTKCIYLEFMIGNVRMTFYSKHY